MKFYPEVKSQTGLSSLWVSCKRALMSSMFIIISIIRIIKITCFNNTILKAELEGKLPWSTWSLSAHNFPSSGYFHKIFDKYLQKGLVCLCTKKFLPSLLYFRNYDSSPNGQIISLNGTQGLKCTSKYNSWGLNGKNYWRFFIVEYLQPNKLKKKSNFSPIY